MCFSFQSIGQLLIWAVVIGGALAILSAIVAYALPKIGIEGVSEVVALLTKIIRIAIVVVVVVFAIIIGIDIISCLLSLAGGMPRLTH